jgi:hypothetical protein
MSRAERLEQLAAAISEAEQALLRAHLIARDLGLAVLAGELAELLANLRQER